MKHSKLLLSLLVFLIPLGSVRAESYVSASMGWTFNAKLKNIKGDENLDYEAPINLLDGSFYPGTHYSNIKLKDVLQGGLKAGHYFESQPNLGLEIEANYAQPNMKRQNVRISNSATHDLSVIDPSLNAVGIGGYIGLSPSGPTISDNFSVVEDQLPAKVKLLQFNLNALYRYQGFKAFTPYIGGGPSINIIRITGTGESGHFVDPPDCTDCVAYGPNVHDTSVNIGANFKLGAEYRLDQDWGLGAEYHYNWVPVDISQFRSANNLNADLTMQSLSVVLTKHF